MAAVTFMQTPNTSKAFVFDVAGVLLDWRPEPYFEKYFADSNLDCSFFLSEVMSSEAQNRISRGDDIDSVLGDLVVAHPDYASAINLWKRDWHQLLPGAIEGTVSVVAELLERDYPVYALGNWNRQEFEWARQRFGFLNSFTDVLLSGDCGILKPDVEIFERAVAQFSIVPQNGVFIDDRADNVQAAIGLGFNGLVFESPRHLYLTLMDYQLL